MKRIAIMVCIAVCIAVIGLIGFRTALGTDNFGAQDQPGAWDGDYADIPFPANDAKGVGRLEQWRKLSNGACAANSVKSLARQFETKATPEAVARAYARWAHEPAVYEACLRGFSG